MTTRGMFAVPPLDGNSGLILAKAATPTALHGGKPGTVNSLTRPFDFRYSATYFQLESLAAHFVFQVTATRSTIQSSANWVRHEPVKAIFARFRCSYGGRICRLARHDYVRRRGGGRIGRVEYRRPLGRHADKTSKRPLRAVSNPVIALCFRCGKSRNKAARPRSWHRKCGHRGPSPVRHPNSEAAP